MLNLCIWQIENLLNLPNYKLSQAKEGFVYRGALLFNRLSQEIRNETNINRFKRNVKTWVKENISVKPKSNQSLFLRGPTIHQLIQQSEQPPQNNSETNCIQTRITDYFN